MDYDKTGQAAVYDAGRGYPAATLELWLRTIAAAVGANTIRDILDLGCGTGRYSGALAEYFGARVIAVDPAETMLAEARKKSLANVTLRKGSGESIPLADGSVDLVFISMAYHHFEAPAAAASECHRVLREGGMACLRAASIDRIGEYPYVPFFSRTPELCREHLASVEAMQRTFVEAGFDCVSHQVVRSELASDWPTFAERTALRADSILQRLSDAEFAEGMERLRLHAATAQADRPVIEPIDFFAFRRSRND
jgi:ubiquinone/menaquinone biosynthesis C-methylase UbiE